MNSTIDHKTHPNASSHVQDHILHPNIMTANGAESKATVSKVGNMHGHQFILYHSIRDARRRRWQRRSEAARAAECTKDQRKLFAFAEGSDFVRSDYIRADKIVKERK